MDNETKQMIEQLGKQITNCAKHDLNETVQLITIVFVGLIELQVSMEFDDKLAKGKINITNDGKRTITLHGVED